MRGEDGAAGEHAPWRVIGRGKLSRWPYWAAVLVSGGILLSALGVILSVVLTGSPLPLVAVVLRGGCAVTRAFDSVGRSSFSSSEISEYTAANEKLIAQLPLPLGAEKKRVGSGTYLNAPGSEGGFVVGVSTSVDLRLAVAPDQAKLVSDFVADLQERGWKTMVLQTSSTYQGSTAPGGLVRYVDGAQRHRRG
jgi:hypothetical protein